MTPNNIAVLHEMSGALYSSVKTGLVIERHGDKVLVEDSSTRQLLECSQRNSMQKEHVVCGDHVSFQRVKASSAPGEPYQSEGLVVGRKERLNLLHRPDPLHRAAQKVKVIAANVSQLFIVVAPVPRVPLLTIDQLLVAGEAYGMRPVLVLNKSDLGEDARRLQEDLAFYTDIDKDTADDSENRQEKGQGASRYPMLRVSAKSGEGLVQLKRELSTAGDGASIFIGQSGVGKSSLINRLMGVTADGEGNGGEEGLEVGALTRKGSLGAHTTTNSRLLRLHFDITHTGRSWEEEESDEDRYEGREEAVVIDSPGIRDLHLWHLSGRELRQAFPEIEAAALQCRFRNCRHEEGAQGCEVQRSVETIGAGGIARSRLQSYFHLLHESEQRL